MEKSNTAMKDIRQTINKISDEIMVRKSKRTTRENLHVRGMDALTQETDIYEALIAVIGEEGSGNAKVGKLIPNRNNTLAVTLTMDQADAVKVVMEGKIRIGYVKCFAERRVSTNRCYKC